MFIQRSETTVETLLFPGLSHRPHPPGKTDTYHTPVLVSHQMPIDEHCFSSRDEGHRPAFESLHYQENDFKRIISDCLLDDNLMGALEVRVINQQFIGCLKKRRFPLAIIANDRYLASGRPKSW